MSGGNSIQDINGYRIHTFTTVGTSTFTPARAGNVEVLVIAGGGSGGVRHAGGGGAGGYIYNSSFSVSGPVTVTVGDGGAARTSGAGSGNSGANSVFESLTAIGGGYGSQGEASGSGGSSGGVFSTAARGTAFQGFQGGVGSGGGEEFQYQGGGGGGAGAVGQAGGGGNNYKAGDGGAGLAFSISGTSTYYMGGGGGSTVTNMSLALPGLGGLGGGGKGGGYNSTTSLPGTPNTGGGGGAGGFDGGTNYPSGKGGSGIVIVRYAIVAPRSDCQLAISNPVVYKGTAAVNYGSGPGVSNRELQGTATITYGGAPTSNTALSLPGTSGSVMNLGTFFPSRADPSTSNVFVEAWVYFNSASSPSTLQFIFTVSDSGSEDMGFYVNFPTQANFRVWNTGGTASQATSGVTINANQWIHFAGSWDRTNNMVYVFVNGVLGATTAVLTGTVRSRSTSSLVLGAGNAGTFFPGNEYIRDFRMVQGGIVPTTNFTPAQALFRLNAPSYVTGGSTVLSLAEQYFTPSWVNFPGPTGNYLNMGTNHPGHFDTASTNLFVECWFYSTGAGGGSNGQVQHIAAVSGPTITTTEVWGLFFFQGNYAGFYMYNTTNNAFVAQNNTALQYNTWYHLAGSWDSVSKNTRVFVNGVVGATVATLTGTARAFESTRALQVGTDFFTGNTAKGYIQDLRIVRGGSVPTSSFTPAAAPFGLASPSYVSGGTTVLSLATQYYQTSMRLESAGTVLLLHCDGTNGSTSFTDSSIYNQTVTNAGLVVNSTAAQKFGTSSFFTNGSAGNYYLSITNSALMFGTSNFTIEFWINPLNPTAQQRVMGNLAGAYISGTWAMGFNSVNGGRFHIDINNVGTLTAPSTAQIAGNWHHIALVRSGSTWYFFQNGVQQATATSSASYDNGGSARPVYIGWSGYPGASEYFNGYLDEIRFTSGVARYTSNFTPATFPFTTSLLQLTNRPILTPVLTGLVGAPSVQVGSTVTIYQTAVQPANGITWSFSPTGFGLSIASLSDYALTLVASSSVIPQTYTVTATNKNSLTTITQFATTVFGGLSSAAAASALGVYSLRSLISLYARVVNIEARYPRGFFSSYITAFGTASASSEVSGGDNPFAWKAFDGLTTSPNYWASAANYTAGVAKTSGTVTVAGGINYYGEWLQIQLPQSFVPTNYTLVAQQAIVNTPGTWYVFGSTNGSTWTLLDTRSGISSSTFTNFVYNTYTITGATSPYNYYRIVCNIVSVNTSFALAEFNINMISSDFYADPSGNLTTQTGGSGQTLANWMGSATNVEVAAFTNPGLRWKLFNGYFNENVSYFTGTPSETGVVADVPSINAGTGGSVPSNGSRDNYSVEWTGYFLSNYTGTWTFYTSSDDASFLWIGSNAASGFTTANSTVNNAGYHGMQESSGTVSLVSGQYYPLRAQFGEAGGGDNMIVSFANPVLAKTTNGSGFFFTGEVPSTSSGLFVTTLYDQSTNGYNLSQPSKTSQPVIDLTTTPYSMIFDGSNRWIYNASFPLNMGAASFTFRYVVSNNTGGNILYKAIGTSFSWSGGEKSFWLGNGSNTEGARGDYPAFVGNGQNFVVSANAITASVKNSVVHKANAGNSVPIYVNGVQASLVVNNISMSNDPGNFLIIGRGGANSNYIGNIFEIELFSTRLSDADRLALEN